MKQIMELSKPLERSLLKRIITFVHRPRMNAIQLILLISVLLVSFYNKAFWTEIFDIAADSQQNSFFLASIFILLVAFINLCLSLVSFKYILKSCLVLILFVATFAAYFMENYGIMIDRSMIRNILTADLASAAELVTVKMLCYVVVLGVIPSLLVLRTEIRGKGLVSALFMVLGAVLTSMAVMVVVLVLFYKDYVSLGKNYNHVRHLMNPVSSLYAAVSYAKMAVTNGKVVVRPIGEDARLEENWRENRKKNLVILVVGEAARAGNFSLNGYEKQTNPLLAQEDVVSFTNTFSCGTVANISVPCMFSHFDRASFSDDKAERHEGLLDVLMHAGVEVLWRENNSGCEGVCNRVETERLAGLQVEGLCDSGECQDMILLQGLQHYISQRENDTVIVLHQKGSYGPGYYRRSPPAFKTFVPECTTNQLQECQTDELVNAYDNTIVATDYLLAQVIALLKENNAQFNTAMLYVSAYGESLGEKNIYLHGLPYLIAPDEQKHVPFILWLADSFLEENGIGKGCGQKKVDDRLSHDHLFHSVLGLMGVRTKMYDKDLDIFAGCR